MRILIAEDDPLICLGLSKRVAELGHEVVGPASDGAMALELARKHAPDLYLFDVNMPVLDGLDVARRLAEEDLKRPVVVITGVEDPTVIDRCIASGVSAYLAKPIDIRELDAAIRLAASRHAETLKLEGELAKERRALAERKLIERAKGLLGDALGLSEQQAYGRLQRAARNRNVGLAEVAAEIVEREDLLRGDAGNQAPRSSD